MWNKKEIIPEFSINFIKDKIIMGQELLDLSGDDYRIKEAQNFF